MSIVPSIAMGLFGLAMGMQGPFCQATDVRVELVDGTQLVGQWNGVVQSGITITSGSESQQIATTQLVSLALAKSPATVIPPSINVTLGNGTQILAQDVTMDEATVVIEPRRQSEIRLPIQQLRSIRFRQGAPATDPQWLGLAEKESRSDLMVIRRGNDQLDPIDGVVVGLDSKKLFFELDGDQIDAPRDRLEGVFIRSSRQTTGPATVKIVDVYGSIFYAAGLEPSGDDSVLVSLGGESAHRIPIDHIQKITWTSGRVMLAKEPPADRRLTRLLETNVPSELINQWFAPKGDGDDIVTPAGGSVDFRIEPGFQVLAGSVVRTPDVANGGKVTVRILIDESVKWEQTFTDASSKGFRIDLEDGRRLRLEVLSADDGDVGDQVRFLKPRLLK